MKEKGLWEDTVYTFIQTDESTNTNLRYQLRRIATVSEFNIIWGYDNGDKFSVPSCFACVVDRTLLAKEEWQKFLDAYSPDAEKWMRVIIVDDSEDYELPQNEDFRKLRFHSLKEHHPIECDDLDKEAVKELDYVLDFNKGLAEQCVGKEGLSLRIFVTDKEEKVELSEKALYYLNKAKKERD